MAALIASRGCFCLRGFSRQARLRRNCGCGDRRRGAGPRLGIARVRRRTLSHARGHAAAELILEPPARRNDAPRERRDRPPLPASSGGGSMIAPGGEVLGRPAVNSPTESPPGSHARFGARSIPRRTEVPSRRRWPLGSRCRPQALGRLPASAESSSAGSAPCRLRRRFGFASASAPPSPAPRSRGLCSIVAQSRNSSEAVFNSSRPASPGAHEPLPAEADSAAPKRVCSANSC